MPLLQDIKNKTFPFEVKDTEDVTVLEGKAYLYFESQQFKEAQAIWLAFDGKDATPEDVLNVRDSLRKMAALRICSWDLQYEKGKTIPITLEGLKAHDVPDDLLEACMAAINEARVPN